MDTRAASGLGGGILLGVVGAVLYFAISAEVSGIDINLVGVILMIAGGILSLVGIISAMSAGRPTTVSTHEERAATPSGTVRHTEKTVA